MVLLSVQDLPTLFADLTPIPQDDGPNSVCRIDYSDDFVTAYDYLRACLKVTEVSQRALDLTELCLTFNPANYTVWQYRRRILKELGSDADLVERIQTDLDLCATLGGENPKNYQIWYHRRAMLAQAEQYPSFSELYNRELQYIDQVLREDGKNYHAWSHRQWLVRTCLSEHTTKNDIVETELAYTDTLLQIDVYNNSAWNHRWYAVHGFVAAPAAAILDVDIAQREIDYAIIQARLDPYNESPWRYLVAIIKEQFKKKNDSTLLLDETLAQVWAVQDDLLKTEDAIVSSNLLSAAVDLLEYKGDAASLECASEVVESLAQEHDPIRKKYWTMRLKEIQAKLTTASSSDI